MRNQNTIMFWRSKINQSDASLNVNMPSVNGKWICVFFVQKKYEHSNQNVVMPIYQILKLLALLFVHVSVAILINNMSCIKTCIWIVYII